MARKSVVNEAAPQAGATLKSVFEAYLDALEARGAGCGTIASYGLELRIALRELGASRPVAGITVDEVAAYFEGPVVTRTRSDVPKARSSIAKTRRVVRLAFEWAQEAGLVEVAPLPKASASAAEVA